MKCPSCGKAINPRATTCKYCKTKLVRKSDKLARQMTLNSFIAKASGGLLICLAGVLAYNDASLFAGISAIAGALLILVGKMMK